MAIASQPKAYERPKIVQRESIGDALIGIVVGSRLPVDAGDT
jgi:hypothetical protein